MGDGALVEFASVVDAVQCAAAIQRRMAERNKGIAAKPGNPRFRIGVNLGDVIVEGDDIYGDGVNIAARLEAMAEPGGVCISGTAFDHAVNKVDVGFADLGRAAPQEHRRPGSRLPGSARSGQAGQDHWRRRAGRVRGLSCWQASAALVVALLAGIFAWQWRKPSATGRPSIAVLPFTNLSGDPGQDYFADGITEDLITDLAKLSGLDVIASNSVFAYKGKPLVLADVGRELGVRFVVDGSVRRTGDQIRLNAQLIDIATGDNLWANRFDRGIAEVFALQDEMSREIARALGVRGFGGRERAHGTPADHQSRSLRHYLRAEREARTGRGDGLREALALYEQGAGARPRLRRGLRRRRAAQRLSLAHRLSTTSSRARWRASGPTKRRAGRWNSILASLVALRRSRDHAGRSTAATRMRSLRSSRAVAMAPEMRRRRLPPAMSSFSPAILPKRPPPSRRR